MASWRSLPPKLICLQERKWGKRTHLKCKLNPYASCPISSASWHSYTLWIEISRVLVSIWTAGLGEKSWQRKEQSVREQKQCLILQSVYSFGKYPKKKKNVAETYERGISVECGKCSGPLYMFRDLQKQSHIQFTMQGECKSFSAMLMITLMGDKWAVALIVNIISIFI